MSQESTRVSDFSTLKCYKKITGEGNKSLPSTDLTYCRKTMSEETRGGEGQWVRVHKIMSFGKDRRGERDFIVITFVRGSRESVNTLPSRIFVVQDCKVYKPQYGLSPLCRGKSQC